MKKISLIAFFAMVCVAAQAQFGVKGGVNVASWGGDDVESEGKKALIGFYGGFFYNVPINNMFSFQPELVYSAQGIRYDDAGIDIKIHTNYVNITPLFRYNNSGFFAGLGPQLGILTSAKAKSDGQSEDIKDQFKSTDIAAVIAAGYELESGIGFYVRYNHGLSKLDDQGDSKVYSRVFQAGLRYKFNMNKSSKQ